MILVAMSINAQSKSNQNRVKETELEKIEAEKKWQAAQEANSKPRIENSAKRTGEEKGRLAKEKTDAGIKGDEQSNLEVKKSKSTNKKRNQNGKITN